MMRLSRKKAIELCIELWERLTETGGKSKARAIKWSDYVSKEEAENGQYCWFCIYNNRKQRKPQVSSSCCTCPYYQAYSFCAAESNTPFLKWFYSKTKASRKKYAKLFLAQIKSIK